MSNINYKKGVTLVEAIVGVSIMLVFVVGVVSGTVVYLKLLVRNAEKAKAAFLLEETFEAVRVLRDTSWDETIGGLNNDTNYYLIFNGNTYTPTTTPTYVDGINRYFVLNDVYRDASDDISETGTLDEDMKEVTVGVEWFAGSSTTTVSANTYIRNQYAN